MTTMTEMMTRLRALWEAAERVAAARLMNPTELSTALTCRNDAVLSIELAFSALQSENTRLRATIAKMDKKASGD